MNKMEKDIFQNHALLSIFLLSASLLVCGCQGKKETSDVKSAESAAVEARESLASQDWERAIELYDKALSDSPNDAEALYGRASARLARGWEFYLKAEDAAAAEQYDQVEAAGKNADERFLLAEADCRAMLKINPDDARAHYVLGCIALYQGDWDGAIASFTTVIKLEPENRFAYQRRGEVFGHIGDSVGEESDLKRAAELGYGTDEEYEKTTPSDEKAANTDDQGEAKKE